MDSFLGNVLIKYPMFEIRDRFSLLSINKCIFQVELDKQKFVQVLFFLFFLSFCLKFYFFVCITADKNEGGEV